MKLAENGYFGVRESLGNVRRRFIATESFVTLQNFKSKFRLLLLGMRWFSKLLRIIFCCKNSKLFFVNFDAPCGAKWRSWFPFRHPLDWLVMMMPHWWATQMSDSLPNWFQIRGLFTSSVNSSCRGLRKKFSRKSEKWSRNYFVFFLLWNDLEIKDEENHKDAKLK